MKLEAKELRLVPASEGVYCSFYARNPGELENMIKSVGNGSVWIEINRMESVRSLNANSYFHVLAQKIASVQGTSLDEVKKHLVLQYGTIARDENGKYMGAQIPKGQNVELFYPYCKYIGETAKFDQVLFMKQTHTLTTSEMSHLIDGTVSECKELGIETLPPEELQNILGRWSA